MKRALPLLAAAALCLVPALWPGDAPFINDEPRLIAAALDQNAAGTLATVGLEGTRGVHYGPLPTWIYQALLLLSHHLPTVVSLRAVGFMVAIALGLFWLGRVLEIPWPLVLLPLTSPYLWLYARELWDNTFLIPLAMLSAGAYARALAEQKPPWLMLAIGTALMMPLVHLMSLAWLLPLALHALIRARPLLRRTFVPLLALAAAWGVIAWPYLHHLLTTPRTPPQTLPYAGAWSFPLWGGRVLSACELDYFLADSFTTIAAGSWLLDIAHYVTTLVYPAVWIGMALTLFAGRGDTAPKRRIAVLLLAVVLTQMLLDALAEVGGHPHYYAATWPAFVGLAWLGLARVSAWRPARALPAVLIACNLIVLATIAIRIHRFGGTRGFGYGPTLANQIEVARELERYPLGTPSLITVNNFRFFPWALQTLMRLEPPAGPPLGARRIVIEYPGSDAHVALRAE